MTPTVLLVNPPIYDFAAYDFFNKPLGLLYLAAFLSDAGYHVRLIDALDRRHPLLANLDPAPKNFDIPPTRTNGAGKYVNEIIDTPECLKSVPRQYRRYGLPADLLAHALAAESNDYPPIAVLITSMMTYWYPAVADTIKLIRRIIPHVPVALGGVYATLMPDHARQVCQPDKLFTGSTLLPVLQWLDDLAHINRDYHALPDDFFSWPDPAYRLYPRLDYLTLITSLGCPFHCDYCASRNLQPHLTQIAPDRFVAQLNRLIPLLKNPQRLNIAFMDDALLARAENHIIPILQQTARLNLPIHFHCPNGLHCRFVTPAVAELLAANHFDMIRLSYESADSASRWQQAGDHKVRDRDLIRAVECLTSAGIPPRQLETYIMTGLPSQTMDEIRRSADFVHQLGVRVRLCQYSPIPGTKLFDLSCRAYGVDPHQPLLHNNSILSCLDRRISLTQFQRFKDHIHHLNRSLT